MIGTVHETYNAWLVAQDGYTENKTIDDEKFVPTSKADKNFILWFDRKTREGQSGNTEMATVFFTLKVIYDFPTKNTLAANQKAAWNNMGSLERGFINFAVSDGKTMFMDSVGLVRIPDQDFYLATFEGRLIYQRSIASS
jgi:hypothetical protein